MKNKLTNKERSEPLMITIGRIRTRIINTRDKRLLELFEHACKKIEENEVKAQYHDTFKNEARIFAELAKRYEGYIYKLQGIKNPDPTFDLYVPFLKEEHD
jgi:hypothetical protein